MSDERLLLDLLSRSTTTHLTKDRFKRKVTTGNDNVNQSMISNKNTVEGSGENNIASGVDPDYNDYGNKPLGIEDITSGCDQYYALGKYYPSNVIDLLVKGVFKVTSFEKVGLSKQVYNNVFVVIFSKNNEEIV